MSWVRYSATGECKTDGRKDCASELALTGLVKGKG